MAIDYETLKLEVAKPAYNGLNDADTAVKVMKANIIDVARTVPSEEFAAFWARRGVIAQAWFVTQDTTAAAAKRRRSQKMIDMVNYNVFASLDTAKPADRDELAAICVDWVADGIMTASEQTATNALPFKPRKGREVWGELDSNDIVIARAS